MKPTLSRSLGLITGVALGLVGLYLAIAGGQLAVLVARCSTFWPVLS